MDFPTAQEFHLITITTASLESIGCELSGMAAAYGAASGSPWTARAFFTPFLVYRPSIVVRLNWINGTTIGDNVDVGVYNEGGNRLVSGGGTAQNTINIAQSVDVTDTLLLPGCYYMAFAIQTMTGFFGKYASGITPTHGAFGVLQMDSAYPLPSTATYVAPTNICVPAMGVTMRTLL